MKRQTNCVATTLFAAMVIGCGDTARQADVTRAVDPAPPAKPAAATAAANPAAATVVLSVPGMT
jgi:hypothetical protein